MPAKCCLCRGKKCRVCCFPAYPLRSFALTLGFELSQGLMMGILYLGVSGLRALLG